MDWRERRKNNLGINGNIIVVIFVKYSDWEVVEVRMEY